MRWTRVAVVLAVIAPALAAQQAEQPTARTDVPRAGSLTAEVHYGTAGDAWFTTNRPAYVALFDVSRNSVRQLYPTFTAQATELAGTSVRVDLRAPVGVSGASSLMPLNAPAAGQNAAWPHTLLVVASTLPLRVGNSWNTTFTLNNDIVRDHDWNDLGTDEGVKAIVDLVRPLDWGAEVATDQAQSATPVTYASSLAHDPNGTALAYSCTDATHTFTSPVPMLGASCLAMRNYPAAAITNAASATVTGYGTADTAQAAKNLHPSAAGPGTSRISEQKHADVQSISDPADIRKFMESWRTSHGPVDGGAAVTPHGGQSRDQKGAQQHDPNRDAARAARHDADRAATTATPGVSRQAAPPSHAADSKPSAPPSGAPASGKPPTERD